MVNHRQQSLIRARDLDETRRGRVSDSCFGVVHAIGMDFGNDPPIRADDLRPRRIAFQPQDSQQLTSIHPLACEKSRRTTGAIRLARTAGLGRIDVFESVLLAKTRQRIGMKTETKAEVEKRGVLVERDRGCIRDRHLHR